MMHGHHDAAGGYDDNIIASILPRGSMPRKFLQALNHSRCGTALNMHKHHDKQSLVQSDDLKAMLWPDL
jgi:hypothetical protein